MLLHSILLMMPSEGEGGSGPFLIMMVLMIVVFYFFMIRPQMRKSKEQKNFREQLKKGDRIVTIGGIHGKVLEVKETTLIIETEGQGRLRVEKKRSQCRCFNNAKPATKVTFPLCPVNSSFAKYCKN